MSTNTIPPTDVGNFTRQPAPPREAATPTTSPSPATAHPAEAERQRLEKEMAEAKEKEDPRERYRKALETVKCTPEKAAEILDSMLTIGYYEEEMDVIPGRLKVKLRSRVLHDAQRIQDELENRRLTFAESQLQVVNEMLLTASIVSLGKTAYKHPESKATPAQVEELFVERRAAIQKVSDLIVPMLYDCRLRFDEKMRVVFREGAIPNF